MKAEELKGAVKALNDSGLIEKKIKMVAVKLTDLEKYFLEAVKGIPEDKEEALPDLVVDAYNSIMKEKGETEQVPVTPASPVKNGRVKESKPKKEKKNGEGEVSRKFLVWQAWSKKKGVPLETLITIGAGVKSNTIKQWRNMWGKGNGLPSGAK